MSNRYVSKVSTQTVSTLVSRIGSNEESIQLDPPYQRDSVWSVEQQSAFIDSVLLGIIPNNLILMTKEIMYV